MKDELMKKGFDKAFSESEQNIRSWVGFRAGVDFAEAQSKWIKTSDMLPEKAQGRSLFQCLAYVDYSIETLYFHYAKGKWFDESNDEVYENVTHWQPLPEPPQQ